MSQSSRAYMYRVTVSILPLLAAWGAVKDDNLPLYLGLAAAVFNVGLAAANTPTKTPLPEGP